MRALLLAAGYGTRLRPITDNVTKCLVPIKGQPLLEIWLDRLTAAGIGPFLINTHYHAEQVSAFINTSAYCNQSTLVYENVLLGTAGTLIKNIDFFQREDGLLIHADNYCLADFSAFIKAHQNRPSKCLMTMMTFRTNTPSSCGIVDLDENNVVIGFHEKVEFPPGNLANGAIYILSSELIKIVKEEYAAATDFSTEILQCFINKIYTYETQQLFIDIGTPEAYLKANSI